MARLQLASQALEKRVFLEFIKCLIKKLGSYFKRKKYIKIYVIDFDKGFEVL